MRAARVRAGISRERLAAALRERGRSTTANTIVRWEATGSIRAFELWLVADLLDVPVTTLLPASA